MGASWRNALKSEFSKAYFEEVFTLSFFFFVSVLFFVFFWGGGGWGKVQIVLVT